MSERSSIEHYEVKIRRKKVLKKTTILKKFVTKNKAFL